MSEHEIWAECPLKHYIRVNLWETYVKKLSKDKIKYLTLYSSDLMDVKYFAKKGYINCDDKNYLGVAVVIRPDDWKKAQSGLTMQYKLKPKVMCTGLLHDLVERRKKEFMEEFAFDVINLDYCNFISSKTNGAYISSNIKDILCLIQQQQGKSKNFVLFVTTRTDNNLPDNIGFAKNFLNDLANKIGKNVKYNAVFREKYIQTFDNIPPLTLLKRSFECFISTGIIKLISMELASVGYTIKDCDAFWLKRNKPERDCEIDLLHLALFISQGTSSDIFKSSSHKTKLKHIGTTLCSYLEKGADIIIDRIKYEKIDRKDEKKDYATLQHIYGNDIKELLKDNFEIKIAEPIKQ